VELLLKQNYNIRFVMDLGCGAGNSLDYFCEKNQTITWVGVDIQGSPEVDSRNLAGKWEDF
jgi:trans-aconitate methyltransferase